MRADLLMIGVIGALFACKRREGAMQPVTMDNFVRAETDTYFAGIQTPNAAASGVYGASRFYTASVASGHGRPEADIGGPCRGADITTAREVVCGHQPCR